jgi:hypothetical protein
MTRAGTAFAILGAALALTGCFHTDVVRTRPGHVHLQSPAPEYPSDPGERYLVASFGGFAGGGAALGGPSGAAGAFALAGEASLHYGTRALSHAEDDFFIYPPRTYGLNVGYNLVFANGSEESLSGYAEAQYAVQVDSLLVPLVGGAVGWAYGGPNAQTGPQATVFAGPFYARVTTLIEGPTDLTLGVFLKLPYSWVWAR